MKAKQSSSLLFLFLFSFFQVKSSIDPTPYQHDATEWINQYIGKGSESLATLDDLQLIANLFYFSYLRSIQTINAQAAARKAFESLWSGWQNIAHTRMNPSLPVPHALDFEQQQKHYLEFCKAQQEHRRIGQAYSQIAQITTKEHYLSASTQEGILRLREHARTVVAQAFLDAKKIVGNLYEIATQGLRHPEDSTEILRFDVLETISYYLPILSMQSFIDAEKAQLKISQQSYEVIHTMLEVNMTIWDTIETARASYYMAHYNALSEYMVRLSISKKYWHILVDEQGINRKLVSPLPKKIV